MNILQYLGSGVCLKGCDSLPQTLSLPLKDMGASKFKRLIVFIEDQHNSKNLWQFESLKLRRRPNEGFVYENGLGDSNAPRTLVLVDDY